MSPSPMPDLPTAREGDDHCRACPVPEGTRCIGFCAWARTGDPKRLRWILDHSPGPGAAGAAAAVLRPGKGPRKLRPPAGGPAPAGAARPMTGPVSVGIVSPGCYVGGAERWMAMLADYCCPSAVRFVGMAARYEQHVRPEMLVAMQARMPVGVGPVAVAELYAACEVVLIWGVTTWDQGIPDRPRACKVALVSHGVGQWTREVFGRPEQADAWVAVSEAAMGPIPPSHRDRAVVLHNGADRRRLVPRLGREEQRDRWGVPREAFVALYLGRMSPEKRPLDFLGAVKYAAETRPDTWGVMVGDGPDRDDVARMARLVAPSRVVLAGVTDDVGSAYQAADVLVMPSREEACSLALLEAWSVGLPVVSTPVGLIAQPEYASLVWTVPEGADPRDVADAIRSVRNARETYREVVTREARRTARVEFSGEAFGVRWSEFLVELARGEAGAGLVTCKGTGR